MTLRNSVRNLWAVLALLVCLSGLTAASAQVREDWDNTFSIVARDPATGRPTLSPLVHNDRVWSAIFTPDGLHILTSSWVDLEHDIVTLWSARTGDRVNQFKPGAREYVRGLVYNCESHTDRFRSIRSAPQH